MLSTKSRVNIVSVKEVEDNVYDVEIEVVVGEKRGCIKISRLTRRPSQASAKIHSNYLFIELNDDKGEHIATCCIHYEHIDRGCLSCPSLLLPPKSP